MLQTNLPSQDNAHYDESCKFEDKFQTMVHELFHITHGQDVESQDRGHLLMPLINA